MFRSMTVLAAAACLALPALAGDRTIVTKETVTTVTIPANEYAQWRDRGYSTQDIFYAYNTAAATKRDVKDILEMRKKGRTWEQIAKECGCDMRAVYGAPVSAVAGERMTLAQGGTVMTRSMSLYPAYERKLPDRFYRSGYRLTPRDFHRFRAAGYTRDEVYLIANAARATGLDPNYFAQAISRGLYARQISLEFGITPNRLTYVHPEWRTPEWAAATGEPAMDRERLDVWW
jgi:hypothetical protein